MPIHSEVTIKVPQLLPVGVDVAGIPTETPRGSATQLLVARRVFGATCSRLAISNLTQTTDNPCRFNFPPTGYVVRQVMFASHFQPPPSPPPSACKTRGVLGLSGEQFLHHLHDLCLAAVEM